MRSSVMVLLGLLFAAGAFAGDVTNQMLLDAQGDAESWLTYGRNYSGWRYSELDEINTRTVKRLAPSWVFQTGVSGRLQTTPLVSDGVMYVTGHNNHAWALDLLTGRELWHYSKKPAKEAQGCCARPNRGFAILGDTLYKVNFGATLVALDAKTGDVLWEKVVADYKEGYSATAAPLIVKNMVLVGIAGAEFGTRDFLDAYDAKTGDRVWRFWTVPGPGEPGHETWGGDSWKRGGGSTWITGTYDPDLNLIYWGTGNPGPDMNGDVRPGDNLYTCSVVALDADTGTLKWHFQFTPHDVHDWDAVADPVLVDLDVEGEKRKALIQANRNGHFYVLDRTTGEFLLARAYTEVTWADGIDAKGRPILIPGKDPTEEGNVACPGLGGGHNWHPTAYSPQTGLYYFDSVDGCHIYYRTTQGYIKGQWYQASTVGGVPDEPATGSIVALDPATGETKWRYEMVSSPSSGLLATAGGLVFGGDPQGYVTAFDAQTGKVLWKFQSGGSVAAAPITYRFRGKQYVTVAAGEAIMTFALMD
ncbi:MAG: PQQ-dependent dehydrogenase, methanol/ethanol family [Bryobacterales bacterium]|nr:PQQ-dependent dehydrogenase, methanol/ethanol family [Bryobacterales bacterium]